MGEVLACLSSGPKADDQVQCECSGHDGPIKCGKVHKEPWEKRAAWNREEPGGGAPVRLASGGSQPNCRPRTNREILPQDRDKIGIGVRFDRNPHREGGPGRKFQNPRSELPKNPKLPAPARTVLQSGAGEKGAGCCRPHRPAPPLEAGRHLNFGPWSYRRAIPSPGGRTHSTCTRTTGFSPLHHGEAARSGIRRRPAQ